MALYFEQRIEQLETQREEDRKLLDTVAAGIATLTVQVQKNHEQAQRNHAETNQRIDETNQRIDDLRDEMNQKFDELRADMNQQFGEVRQDIRDIKSTLSLVIKILEEKL